MSLVPTVVAALLLGSIALAAEADPGRSNASRYQSAPSARVRHAAPAAPTCAENRREPVRVTERRNEHARPGAQAPAPTPECRRDAAPTRDKHARNEGRRDGARNGARDGARRGERDQERANPRNERRDEGRNERNNGNSSGGSGSNGNGHSGGNSGNTNTHDDNGHGNDPGGVDPSNPGRSEGSRGNNRR